MRAFWILLTAALCLSACEFPGSASGPTTVCGDNEVKQGDTAVGTRCGDKTSPVAVVPE